VSRVASPAPLLKVASPAPLLKVASPAPLLAVAAKVASPAPPNHPVAVTREASLEAAQLGRRQF
jgi:hypothetical protein